MGRGPRWSPEEWATLRAAVEAGRRFREMNGTRVDWPPSSSDLSPLDYSLWKRWEDELGDRREVVGMARLKAQITAAHRRIPLADVQAAILNWPKRLKACIKAGGSQFEHGMV